MNETSNFNTTNSIGRPKKKMIEASSNLPSPPKNVNNLNNLTRKRKILYLQTFLPAI